MNLDTPEFSVTLENTGTKATSTCRVYWNVWKGTRGSEYDRQTVEKECSVPAEDSQTVDRLSGDVITETGPYTYWVRVNYDGKWYPSDSWYPIDPYGAEFTVEERPFDNTITLQDGLNLVSVPYKLTNPTTVFTGHTVKYLTYDGLEPKFETPASIEPGYGYYVISSGGEVTLTEDGDPDPIDLVSGLNLIGHMSTGSEPVEDALSSIDGKYMFVVSYTGSEWELYLPGADNSGAGRFTDMKPGRAYWVLMSESGTYTVA